MKFNDPTIKLLLRNYRSVWALMYSANLINWDTETYMPHKGIDSRSRILSDLNLSIQKQLLDKEFLTILDEAEKIDDLNEYESKTVYYLQKTVDQYQKLPPKFISLWSELIGKASTIWAKARKENDYDLFEPYLNKIFELTRQRADYLGFNVEAYDAIFDMYEDGFTTKELLTYFQELKIFLKRIDLSSLNKNINIDIGNSIYSKVKMKALNERVLKFLGHDPTRFRLDTSSHPFSLFLSPDDIRLTTRYPKVDFTASLLPTIHEFGHGLFASNTEKEFEATPLWPDTSYALHESLSRYWENIIGRSKGFSIKFLKDIQGLNKEFKGISYEDIYNYLNRIKPSLIRVDADEITYHYHIIIRFEIERALINKELNTKDASGYWDELYKKYLGIKPKNHSEGILQDIHWAFGSVGYFPTYSLGSTLSAIWDKRLRKELNIDYEVLDKKEINDINKWFKHNIHEHAGMYNLEEITQKAGGCKFSSKPWQDYIVKKYGIKLK